MLPRLMLIDDDEMVARAMQRLLTSRFVVRRFGDAADALASIQAGEVPDVIVCDLMMPRMTGMEFHEALCRASPDLAGRCLFVTGGSASPRGRQFIERHRDRVLQKPVPVQTLFDALDIALGGESPLPSGHEGPGPIGC